MLILVDRNTPTPLRLYLNTHTVTEARERGLLINGDLLNAAEMAGFEFFLTADKNRAISKTVRSEKSRSGSV